MNERDELIYELMNMTPEQIKRFLAHPTVVEIMNETKKGQ